MKVRSKEAEIFIFLIEIKRIISEEMPVENMISWDVIVIVLAGYFDGRNVQVKSLLSSMPHSKTGIRYCCEKLINDGWIQKKESDSDARVKLLLPTEKLLNRCSHLITKLAGLKKEFQSPNFF